MVKTRAIMWGNNRFQYLSDRDPDTPPPEGPPLSLAVRPNGHSGDVYANDGIYLDRMIVNKPVKIALFCTVFWATLSMGSHRVPYENFWVPVSMGHWVPYEVTDAALSHHPQTQERAGQVQLDPHAEYLASHHPQTASANARSETQLTIGSYKGVLRERDGLIARARQAQ